MAAIERILGSLGVDEVAAAAGASAGAWIAGAGPGIDVGDPVRGGKLAHVGSVDQAGYDQVVDAAARRFEEWRERPAPRRAELVRRLAGLLREHKAALGELISVEAGKAD